MSQVIRYLRSSNPNGSAVAAAGVASVDKSNRVLRGFVVAETGDFKTELRGHFDSASLDSIVSLMRAAPLGVKSHFTHGSLFNGDRLGWFVGRARNPRRDNNAVRADLHLDASAFVSPFGDLGTYLLTLAHSDPASFGSSLVLTADRHDRPRLYGRQDQSPIWRPTSISQIDVVADGDAVHSGFMERERTAQEIKNENQLALLELEIALLDD